MHLNPFSKTIFVAGTLGALALAGCSSPQHESSSGGPITKSHFGKMPNGQDVDVYRLRNANGAEASIITYGGTMISLKVPDKNGKLGDVVLGYDTLDPYLTNSPYFGALIGRYGNRIGGASFTLGTNTYQLPANDGPNCLHGGKRGFDKVVWKEEYAVAEEEPKLVLSYVSPDGDQGFPGTLNVTATYTLTHDNAIKVQFYAVTDKPTVCNLTDHSYFNLAEKGTILDHIVYIPADKITPVDNVLIPTGSYMPVEGTPFDFRTPTPIGARIDQDNEQLKFGKGYDHNWVINKNAGELTLMARVTEPTTGRVLEVLSDEPGLQFYSGNFLDGTITGKYGRTYEHRAAFCMEPQHFPDSPNKPQFPSTELKPGQSYHNTIIYKFSVQ